MFRPLLQGLSARIPSRCAVCHAWPSRPLCDACVERFAQPVARCRTCAIRMTGNVSRCGECVRQPPPLSQCLAAVDYGFPWADAIHGFKFRGEAGWARALATLLHSTPWVDPALESARWVVPMPMSKDRLLARGFNQASLLVRQLAPVKRRDDLLLRVRDTAEQHRLSREDRLHNLGGAFVADPLRAHDIAGASVVLVDDVMTTGATLSSAAAALLQAGASEVTAVVVARTPLP